MCLLTNCYKGETAEKDIPCYKALTFSLHVSKCSNTLTLEAFTPIMLQEVVFNDTIRARGRLKHADKKLDDSPTYSVEKQGVHVYLNKNRAELVSTYFRNRVVVHAIIPKGTVYWMNIFNDKIAAKKLIIGKIVDSNPYFPMTSHVVLGNDLMDFTDKESMLLLPELWKRRTMTCSEIDNFLEGV